MKILHTADWHIGQLFHAYDRTYEHQQFLDWLVQLLKKEHIDVLLISGDVFDISNPASISVKLFYSFLNQAIKSNPAIQIIITAGNHDSATRLESPKPLLESSNIHIVGLIERNAEGNIDYDKLIIPLHDAQGTVKTWCLAIPFLRLGDYPVVAESPNPYADGVAVLYKEAFDFLETKKQAGQSVIAMGHLHANGAEITMEKDNPERLIMGGMECIAANAFPEAISYVALGHIHKAQKVGSKEHIRYSGSPLPLSFSELHYKHQVITFEIDEEKIQQLTAIEVPSFVALLRVPSTHQPLQEVIPLLEALPDTSETPESAPYLEVRVLLENPEPSLRYKIETALTGKHVRLARIDPKYPKATNEASEHISQETLTDLQPMDVFSKIYQSKYNAAVPETMMELFQQVAQDINTRED